MNKSVWNKLTKFQQKLWTKLNRRFYKELRTPSSMPNISYEAIAHNLALIAVWEVGGDKVVIMGSRPGK